MNNHRDNPADKSEICFLFISFLLIFLGFISTYSKISQMVTNRADIFDKMTFIANLIFFSFTFSYYYLLIKKKKPHRLLVSLPFTVYIFFLFLISSYYYIVPAIGMILALILLSISRIKRQGIIISGLSIFLSYSLIMILQVSGILPIYVNNIDSTKSVNFAFLICIEAILVGVFFGIYTLASREIRAIFSLVKKDDEKRKQKID